MPAPCPNPFQWATCNGKADEIFCFGVWDAGVERKVFGAGRCLLERKEEMKLAVNVPKKRAIHNRYLTS